MLEAYYTKARQQGVLFTRYDLDHKPEVTEEDATLSVTTLDPTIQRKVRLKPDLLVLSAAVIPRENDRVANLFKVSRTLDGFYLEAHMKLRPVDFARDGVFMAGLGHGPKPIDESISQAAAAVSRACTVISKDRMQVGGVVAKVEADKCAVCLICVRACPYDVPTIHEDGYSTIDPSRCQGCGTCVAECPNKAIELQHYTDHQILEKGKALIGETTLLVKEQTAEGVSEKGE
jgi:heterodisulfide reductase subunit A